ncbi:UNVERIFIED_CONTAM: hypothetical protein NCL1_40720 [Trichonephila clavipes]
MKNSIHIKKKQCWGILVHQWVFGCLCHETKKCFLFAISSVSVDFDDYDSEKLNGYLAMNDTTLTEKLESEAQQ